MPTMRNSRISDQTIYKWVTDNPIQVVPGTGNIRLIGRLCFVNLLKPGKPLAGSDPNKEPTYNTCVMLPPWCEAGIETIIKPTILKTMREHFPQNVAADGSCFGLADPLHVQDEKAKQYEGFTPGLLYFSASTQRKPMIVDPSQNPIVDEARVHSGVWAMLAVNIFPYGHNKKLPKKGVGMGLQNIMIIAEDDNLGGSSPPPEADFAGVNLAQNFDPAGQFGAGSAGPPVPPAASVLPPARLVTPPPAYALPPAPVRTEDLW